MNQNLENRDKPAGVVAAVLLGLRPDSLITTCVDAVQAVPGGFTGDRHFGLNHPADSRTSFYPRGTLIFNDRQVSIVSLEELSQIAARLDLPEIQPEWLGANLVTRGIPQLSRLAPGTRLIFSGGASLYVTHSNNPCAGPGKILQEKVPDRPGLVAAFIQHAMHLRGLVAVVDKPGEIQVGEGIEVRMNGRYMYLE